MQGNHLNFLDAVSFLSYYFHQAISNSFSMYFFIYDFRGCEEFTSYSETKTFLNKLKDSEK